MEPDIFTPRGDPRPSPLGKKINTDEKRHLMTTDKSVIKTDGKLVLKEDRKEQLPIMSTLCSLLSAMFDHSCLIKYIPVKITSSLSWKYSATLDTVIESANECYSSRLIWHDVRIAVDILAAVEHLRSCELVHCDIKPENVFVNHPSHPTYAVLADFDLMVGPEKKHENGLTTIRFMAPEMVVSLDQKQRVFGYEIDAWGAACTIMLMLTNRLYVYESSERNSRSIHTFARCISTTVESWMNATPDDIYNHLVTRIRHVSEEDLELAQRLTRAISGGLCWPHHRTTPRQMYQILAQREMPQQDVPKWFAAIDAPYDESILDNYQIENKKDFMQSWATLPLRFRQYVLMFSRNGMHPKLAAYTTSMLFTDNDIIEHMSKLFTNIKLDDDAADNIFNTYLTMVGAPRLMHVRDCSWASALH